MNVDFYRKESGECPIQEYLDSLSQNLGQKGVMP